MVSISQDVKDSVARFLKLVSGRTRPRNSFERRIQRNQGLDVEELEEGEETYGGFQLTPGELEDAVGKYRDWLDDVRAEIKVSKNTVRSLKDQAKNLRGEESRDAKYELQLEWEKLQDLRDERDEVEAKLQSLKRELNDVRRQQRRKHRQDRDPVDWQEYDDSEFRKEVEEQRRKRQKEQQAVRKMRNRRNRVRDTEKPDLSDADELLGEEEAEEIREVMNSDWDAPENDWLEQKERSQEEEVWDELQ